MKVSYANPAISISHHATKLIMLVVEHNIKSAPTSRGRRPSMTSFFNQLSQIETSSPSTPHNNPHAVTLYPHPAGH